MRHSVPSRPLLTSSAHSTSAYHDAMDGIIINVNWEYFLGILGSLMAIAYHANGRLTRLETSVEWLQDALRSLKIASENGASKLFNTNSPISLTNRGRRVLKESGLRSYIDAHKPTLTARCKLDRSLDPYERQSRSFRLFADVRFEPGFEQQLNEFAFANGLSADLLRRVGAIYFRDLTMASK